MCENDNIAFRSFGFNFREPIQRNHSFHVAFSSLHIYNYLAWLLSTAVIVKP